jgi:hypothetical protein
MLSAKNQNTVPIITKLQYQFPQNISSFEIGSTPQHRTISFSNGEAWKDLYFTPGTPDFSQTSKRTSSGKIYNQTLSFSSPGDDPVSDSEMEKIEELMCVAKITYSDGTAKIIGSDKNSANFSNNFKSDSKATKNSFAIKCSSITKAFFIE